MTDHDTVQFWDDHNAANVPTITADDARTLAIVYGGWITRVDDVDTLTWGRSLLDIQDRLGIEVVKPWIVQDLMHHAERRYYGAAEA